MAHNSIELLAGLQNRSPRLALQGLAHYSHKCAANAMGLPMHNRTVASISHRFEWDLTALPGLHGCRIAHLNTITDCRTAVASTLADVVNYLSMAGQQQAVFYICYSL